MNFGLRRASLFLFFITGGTALSGYLREMVLAHLFGTNTGMDAFYFSFGLIQAVHDLLFSGVLAATVIPLLHAPSESDEARWKPKELGVTLATTVTIVSGLTCLLLTVSLPKLIELLAPGLPQEAKLLSLSFARLLIFFLPLNALTTLFALILNGTGRFTLPALVYLWNNVSFIGIVLFLSPILNSRSVPIACLVGPAVSVICLFIRLRQLDLLGLAHLQFNKHLIQAVSRLSGPILFSVGIGSTSGLLMSSHLLIRSFATDYQTGAIAALGYAFRIYEAPLSLIANPAATIILPVAARLYARGDLKGIENMVRELLIWAAIILTPIAILTWGGADLIISFLLKSGNFDANSVRTTAEALRGFAPAICAEAVFIVSFRIFYAMHRPGRAISTAFASLASLIILLASFAHAGFIVIPLSLSGSFVIAAIFTIGFLRKDIGPRIFPSAATVVRFGIGLTASLVVYSVFGQFSTDKGLMSVLGLIAFISAYAIFMSIVLPEQRRAALNTITNMS